MKRLLMMVGMVVCLLGTAPRAKAVDQWTWFSHPYAYFMAEREWGYFNPNDSQWCYDFALGGQWSRLGQNALANGWVHLTYPYAYSLPAARWFYLNEADAQWVYYFGSATWRRFGVAPAPAGMVLIPAGSFQMGNCMDPDEGMADELPVHTVSVSAFYMDRNLVTKAQWDEVFSWAASQQPWYNFDAVGIGKGSNYPAQPATWYDCVKWCNARSEKEGLTPCYYVDARHTPANVYRGGQVDIQDDWVAWNSGGYRLPTEAEWEKAARGGVSGGRFPWGDTIDHDRANYISFWQGIHPFYPYDAGYEGHDTRYEVGAYPFTSPVGSFAPNGYGLYDVAGNLRQWCWDWYDAGWYANGTATQSDTHGPATGNSRLLRNGAWYDSANYSRCSSRVGFSPQWTYYFGFRCVR